MLSTLIAICAGLYAGLYLQEEGILTRRKINNFLSGILSKLQNSFTEKERTPEQTELKFPEQK